MKAQRVYKPESLILVYLKGSSNLKVNVYEKEFSETAILNFVKKFYNKHKYFQDGYVNQQKFKMEEDL